jgi:hypothetical protein
MMTDHCIGHDTYSGSMRIKKKMLALVGAVAALRVSSLLDQLDAPSTSVDLKSLHISAT